VRTLVLVDGEHHPPVMRAAIDLARARGHDVVAALLVGGSEKLQPGIVPELGVPLRIAGDDRCEALAAAIDIEHPEMVLDLSDEPVLGYRERMQLVAVALARGVTYLGADFRLEPPVEGPPVDAPTLAVIGTGKRAGKTAIAGAVARHAAARGIHPVLVAMGRGGPFEPQVVEAGSLTVERLLELSRAGHHAASDYLEDAITTGITTVGAWRAGGGLAGKPYASTVRQAAELAAARRPDLLILEGSGSAVPTVPWDAGVLVVPASAPPEYLLGYLGPYRLLMTDLLIVTMGAGPDPGSQNLSELRSLAQRSQGGPRPIVTDFVPEPLADVTGRRVFFATTAPEPVASRQVRHLEDTYGCDVVAWSARLADRTGLAEDLDAAHGYDVLLTELKAAAVAVGVERALARGAEVVFVDNRAVVVSADADLDQAFGEVLDLARSRAAQR